MFPTWVRFIPGDMGRLFMTFNTSFIVSQLSTTTTILQSMCTGHCSKHGPLFPTIMPFLTPQGFHERLCFNGHACVCQKIDGRKPGTTIIRYTGHNQGHPKEVPVHNSSDIVLVTGHKRNGTGSGLYISSGRCQCYRVVYTEIVHNHCAYLHPHTL